MNGNKSYYFYPYYNSYNNFYNNLYINYNNNNYYKPNIKYKPLSLGLNEALSISSYPKSNQDLIRKLIINDFKNDENAKVYFSRYAYEKLIIIEYTLSILFLKRNYNVILYIHLPTLFPDYPPEFFIFKKKQANINKFYLDGKINPQTFKINLNKFYFFDPVNIKLKYILNSIKSKFNEHFPIYKDSKMKDNLNVEYYGKNNLNLNELP